MNRFSLLSILFLCCMYVYTAPAFAQKKKKSKTTKKVSPAQIKGDHHFSLFEFYSAAQEYKSVVDAQPDNMYCTYRLAECYREYFEYANAEKYYKIVLDKDREEFPLSRFWYAIMLRDNGRYETAKKQFEQFLSEYKESTLSAEEYKERAKKAINGLNMALEEMKKPMRDYSFKCLPPPVNTEYSEYSPVIFGTNYSIIVITSSRKGTTGNASNTMLGGNMSDNYRYVYDGKADWTEHELDDNFELSNSMYNESPGSFTADGSKFYFTRCDEKIAIGKFEDYNCVIYVMKKGADGKWGEPIRLNENINMRGQWNSQPSVSPDGKILFFTSKRPGGLGMHDIWYSTCGGDDNWGTASNLGEGVNTLFTDMSPRYYGDERLLYFASNGHNGFGGLDIFVAKEDEDFANAINVGMPFNSHRDDFYYVLGQKKGYLSSNRQGGQGNDDIYEFNIIAKEDAVISEINADSIPANVKSISIVGALVDENGNKASNVEIALADENNVHIKVTKTNEEGVFRFDNLPAGRTYKVVLVEKDAKVTQKIALSIDTITIQSSTMVAKRTLFENIYFDFNKYDLRPEAQKTLQELVDYAVKHPEIQIELNANTDGLGTDTYNRDLSEKRGQAAIDFLVQKGIDRSRIVMNPLGKERPLTSNENEIGRQLNRRVEFYILGGPGYETQNMTYVVQPKATLYSIAQKFNMTIEEIREINALSSDDVIPYTPLRVRRNVGDNDIIAQVSMTESMAAIHDTEKKNKKYYNKLAKKNSAIEEAMIQSNVEIAKKNEIIEAKNTEIKQNLKLKKQQNIKLKEGEDLYKVRPHNTLFSISKLYHMSVDDLKSLNQITGDTIYVNQLIKVKVGIYTPSANEYLVKEADSIESIATFFDMSVEQLMVLNPLDGYTLQRNMILRIRKD